MAREMDPKGQLARDVCTASSAFSSCTHRRGPTRKPAAAAFMDWYLVLRINEDSSDDTIKRRYRQLALQLHPDKNRHPKADVAFKLVSEAYSCLTDEAQRRSFDAERRLRFCMECHEKYQHNNHRSSTDRRNAHASTAKGRPRRVPLAQREVQNRLQDECRVIENCLKANDSRRRNSFPLFDPSDSTMYPDYPHNRTRVSDHQREFWCYQQLAGAQSFSRRDGNCESPVYQIRSQGTKRRTKSSWQIK